MRRTRVEWILLLLPLMTALAGGMVGLQQSAATPKTYRAMSRVLVSVSPNAAEWVPAASATQIQTFSELVSTAAVLDPVAARLGGGLKAADLSPRVSGHVALNTNVIDVTAVASGSDEAMTLANEAQASLIQTIDRLGPRSAANRAMMQGVSISKATTATPSGGSTPLALVLGMGVGALAGLVISRTVARHI